MFNFIDSAAQLIQEFIINFYYFNIFSHFNLKFYLDIFFIDTRLKLYLVYNLQVYENYLINS